MSFADPAPEDNGNTILSYELVMDDGRSGEFQSLVGLEQDSLLTSFTVDQAIVKGRRHRFRYRARN